MLLTRWELRYEKNQCRGKAKVPTCVMEALTGEMREETVAIIYPSLMLIQDNPTSTEGNAFLYRKNKSWLGEFQRFLELMHSNVLLVCIRTLKSEIQYNYHYTCKVVLMACIRIFWSFLASKQQIFFKPCLSNAKMRF